MPTKEIVLTEHCPGCAAEGRETFLRNQLGVFGAFCLDESNVRRHIYSDSEALKEDLSKMAAKKPAPAVAVSPKKKPKEPKELKVAVQGDVAEVTQSEEETLSAIEDVAITLNAMDCYRLSELLNQPVTTAGDLVGATWGLRNDMNILRGEKERMRQASSPSQLPQAEIMIPQRADGGLTLQVYIPDTPAKQLADKANFNGQGIGQYSQALMEYQMAVGFFPVDVDAYPEPTSYDGCWIAINVPEAYVGTMIEKASSLSMTPTEYLSNYTLNLIHLELFP